MTDKIVFFESKRIRSVWVEADGNEPVTNCHGLKIPPVDDDVKFGAEKALDAIGLSMTATADPGRRNP